jgi:hypothetical protein
MKRRGLFKIETRVYAKSGKRSRFKNDEKIVATGNIEA